MPNIPDVADNDLELLSEEECPQLAIAALKKTRISERAAANYYRVPRSTLQDRRKGLRTRVEAHAHRCALSTVQEAVLKEWVKIVGKRGFPLTLATISAYASEIIGAPVGETWPQRFKKRHPDLKIKWASALEECRARALNPVVVNEYFTLLRDTIERFEIKTKNIYNIDEKGIQLGVGEKIKALVNRDQKTVSRIHTGNRDLVTIIECICANGTALHPSVVFEGARRDLRWDEDNPSNASISISPNGWTDQELGTLWQEKDFAPATAEKLDDPADYRLLILDGHNSHGTFRFIDFAEKHRIVILCLPSHTTHALQPCDVGVFGPLARKWKSHVSEQHRNNIIIDKYNLLANYSVAREQALRKENILSAFRKCGISPLDESAIDTELFAPALNYTTQAAQPLPARLPSLLIPLEAAAHPRSSILTADNDSFSATSSNSSATAESSSSRATAQSSSSRATAHLAPGAAHPSPTQPRPSTPPPSDAAARMGEVVQALYKIAVPSPLCGTASRKAMTVQNDKLRSIAMAAGVELERNHVQMILMDKENARLHQQLHAKIYKKKRTYTTGQARLMTGPEMHQALLEELQKKLMVEMHAGLKQLFPDIRKEITQVEKDAKAAAKKAEKDAKKAEWERKAAEKAAAKLAKATEKEAVKAAKAVEKEAAKARGQGRGSRRGRGHGGHGSGNIQSQGTGRGRATKDTWDTGDEESSPEPESSSDEEADHVSTNPGPHDTDAESSDEELDLDKPQDESDDSDDEGVETAIASINGHRWRARNVEFQVLWEDSDVTWEPLSVVNDCSAMDDYLAHRDLSDPLLLPKRKYLINKAFQATNE